jgi:hypothetical protein
MPNGQSPIWRIEMDRIKNENASSSTELRAALQQIGGLQSCVTNLEAELNMATSVRSADIEKFRKDLNETVARMKMQYPFLWGPRLAIGRAPVCQLDVDEAQRRRRSRVPDGSGHGPARKLMLAAEQQRSARLTIAGGLLTLFYGALASLARYHPKRWQHVINRRVEFSPTNAQSTCQKTGEQTHRLQVATTIQ